MCLLTTLFRLYQGSKHLEKSLVESFNLATSHRMYGVVRDFSALAILHSPWIRLDSKHWTWILYACRKTVMYDKIIEQNPRRRDSYLILCRNGLCISREMIGYDGDALNSCLRRFKREVVKSHDLHWIRGFNVDKLRFFGRSSFF